MIVAGNFGITALAPHVLHEMTRPKTIFDHKTEKRLRIVALVPGELPVQQAGGERVGGDVDGLRPLDRLHRHARHDLVHRPLELLPEIVVRNLVLNRGVEGKPAGLADANGPL